MDFIGVRKLKDDIFENISRVIAGKKEVIDLVLVSILCGGHILLEDVPGVGKTVLARSLAKSINCEFRRIQFTPDLLPSDLTGINFYNQKQGDFVFRPGPLFSQIVLADELNRATPRTQSSLLECMEEGQITIDGETRKLSDMFFVIATQNPVETMGTFPLPEAQLDRFFMRLQIGYPSTGDGRVILDRFQSENPLKKLEAVASADDIAAARLCIPQVWVGDALKDYILSIIEATRSHNGVALGVSPRGSLALMKAAQAMAVFCERDYVTPDDIKKVAVPVLAHRIIVKGSSLTGGFLQAVSVISDILGKLPVPVEEL